MEDLIAEAKDLDALGVRELNIVAQDVTRYGQDLYGGYKLHELLHRITEETSIPWIRLLYCYPDKITDELIAEIRDNDRIVKYIDMPLQHISDPILKRMNRHGDSTMIREVIGKLRREIPDLTLRTTFIVGFPGETERDFEELCRFVEETRFEHMGVFTYSAEEGTYSAEKLTDDVPDDVKQARADEIMQLQSAISYNYNASREGRVERVIVDGKVDGRWVARSQYDSPEVDTEIEIITEKRLRRGCFYNVRIVEADEYDLVAELI
jgi:ribosomal protein S12 methylthiotransferase